MAFGGGSVPRDAGKRVRFTTSTYDPARGGFSGAQTQVELQPGFDFILRHAHLTLDAPFLQATDPVARGYGQRFTTVDAGVGGSGSLIDGRLYYNLAAQGSRRTSTPVSLLDASPVLLQHAGVAADSAARLVALLGATGVPVTARGLPATRTDDHLTLIGRIDHTPRATVAWDVTGYLDATRQGAATRTPLAAPSTESEQRRITGMLKAERSRYFHHERGLNETRTALTLGSTRALPYLSLPGATVQVISGFPDSAGDAGGIAALRFGGDPVVSRTRSLLWETENATTLMSADGRHRLQLTVQARYDARSQLLAGADRYGTFSFNSLADLAAGHPSTYTRALAYPDVRADEWSGFLALGDLWKPSDRFQLLYGARLEGNRFPARPAYNAALDRALGVRTDAVPNTMHLSPRIGFTWVPRRSTQGIGMMVNPMGTFWSAAGNLVLRGGIGEFRNFMPPALLTTAVASTGLPGAQRELACFGPAAPTPAWGAYVQNASAIPTTCAVGSGGTFADAAPGVRAFAPGYTAPRSWRGNLALTTVLWRFTTTIDGTYALNLDQPSTLDANFANAPRFALAGEGGRPVFVPPASIDPATGVVSPVAARRVTDFGRVLTMGSDARSVARALTISVLPQIGFGTNATLGASYTLQSVRARSRGLDATTFGSPVALQWGRGDLDVRHQIMLSAGFWTRNGWSFAAYGRFASGLPFTPIVGRDVNGDGLPNDRAFVFDPATVTDTALGRGMRSLLETAPSGVRTCLAAQLGRAATRNSCTGPWTAMLNMRIGVSSQALHLGDRPRITLDLANPLGGLDQLLHGADHLHGWGTTPLPDPVLYTPRGFDPAAGRFVYAVNPRFGDTRAARTTLRAPFRVTLDVTVNLAPPFDQQQLDRTLQPGRNGHPGRRLSEDSVLVRYRRSIPDPYGTILLESDSLLLTRDQVAALRRADTLYRARIDSVWRPLAHYLANLGDRYDAAAALRRANAASDSAWAVTHAERPTVRRILTPLQWQLAPGMAKSLLDPKSKLRFFFG